MGKKKKAGLEKIPRKPLILKTKMKLSGDQLMYLLPCPKCIEEIELDDCKACSYKLSFGAKSKKIISKTGKETHESVLTIECSYFKDISDKDLEKYVALVSAFYGKKPKKSSGEKDEVDELTDEYFPHISPQQRSGI